MINKATKGNKMKTSYMISNPQYMLPETGSVDTLDGWFPSTLENSNLIEVKKDDDGNWVEV